MDIIHYYRGQSIQLPLCPVNCSEFGRENVHSEFRILNIISALNRMAKLVFACKNTNVTPAAAAAAAAAILHVKKAQRGIPILQ